MGQGSSPIYRGGLNESRGVRVKRSIPLLIKSSLLFDETQ